VRYIVSPPKEKASEGELLILSNGTLLTSLATKKERGESKNLQFREAGSKKTTKVVPDPKAQSLRSIAVLCKGIFFKNKAILGKDS